MQHQEELQDSRTLLEQAIEEGDPCRFIKSLIQKKPDLVADNRNSKKSLLQLATFHRRIDLIPRFLLKDKKEGTNIDACSDEKSTFLLTHKQPPLLLAANFRKQFDITPEVLFTLGADMKLALDTCSDDKMQAKVKTVKPDRDILCGLLFSNVVNIGNPDLFARMNKKGADSKGEDVVPLEAFEEDLFGLIDLAAYKKSADLLDPLLAMNHNRMRDCPNFLNAAEWAKLQGLEDMKKKLSTLQPISKPCPLPLAFSHHAKIIYDQAKVGKLILPEFERYAEKDYRDVLYYAYQIRDLVAVNAILQFALTHKKEHVLFEEAFAKKDRGLFFILLFATESLPENIARAFPQQKNTLLEFFGEHHRDLEPATPPAELSQDVKMKMIEDCLAAINTCVTQYGKCARLSATTYNDGVEVLSHISFIISSIITGIYWNNFSNYNSIDTETGNNDDPTTERDFAVALASTICLAFSLLIIVVTRGTTPRPPSPYLIFGNLDHLKITDIPDHNDALVQIQRIIQKFENIPDFDLKLTSESKLGEFRETLPRLKAQLQTQYGRFDLFAESDDVKNDVATQNKSDKDTLPSPKK